MALELTKTADGMTAARIAHSAYAIMPTTDGHFRILSRLIGGSREAIGSLQHQDFSVHGGGRFSTHEAAIEELEAIDLHTKQHADLGRRSTTTTRRTPWGPAQGGEFYATGVESFSTAGHGGFKLDRTRNARVPEELRNLDGWYEEDQEWAKVAFAFPELFTDRENGFAQATIRNHYPDAYEALKGVVLQEGESIGKDERVFRERHANDWLVISATGNADDTVTCFATIGGQRQSFGGPAIEEKRFIVPASEYRTRKFEFVIDPTRHAEILPEPTPAP